VDGDPATSAARTSRGFRRDIQGIRGFALILVLACHAELPGFGGGYVGLDVFYVLSGFLITGLILDELRRTGTVSLRDFYARRARRLLPLAVTVLVATLLAALVLFPVSRLHQVSDDVLAAALYVANWSFIAQQVDYFAFEDGAISPVQHFWSLSVEEQFYLVWPVLLLALAVLAVRLGARRRVVLTGALLVLGGASLWYAIAYTAVDPGRAYFSTLTRGWELALGGVLAVVLPAGLRLPRTLGWALAGGGLGVLVATTIIFTSATPYPGWQALLPAFATVAVMVAGTATRMTAPIRLLAAAPLQTLGRISYAWYLWHWPAIVIAAAVWGPLTVGDRVLVTLASGVPTVISHHLIEERFRRSRTLAARPRRSLALGGGFTTAAVALAFAVVIVRPGLDAAPAGAVTGARSAAAPLQENVSAIRPTPATARDDRGRMFDDGCLVKGTARTSPSCVYGDPHGDTTVVLFGDSHALQYFPALERIASRRGWRLVGLARASCPIGLVDYQPTCNAWRANTLRRIERRERPDLVIASSATDTRFRVKVDGRRLSRTASEPLLEAGYARTFRRLAAGGTRIAVLRDQGRAPLEVADCVSEHHDDLRRCAFRPRRPWKLAFDVRGARRAHRGVTIIDPIDVLCPRSHGGGRRLCAPVIGNVLVYRDTYHMSATFAATLADWLEGRLPRVG
jgi:peptidoglycan/LPS O-acetylase OafA/YrhL